MYEGHARQATTTRVEPRGPGRPRSEKARKAVIQSTLTLLKRVGFNELTIEAVAARAGVGKATVYRWWPNKAELVIAAFRSCGRRGTALPFCRARPGVDSRANEEVGGDFPQPARADCCHGHWRRAVRTGDSEGISSPLGRDRGEWKRADCYDRQ